MTKYQEYFQDMLENHKDLFNSFKDLHDKYEKDSKKWQKEFNEKGEEVLSVIRKYENMLCGKSEAGKFSKFSTNLADKFWTMIRSHFPKIDHIGIIH